MPTPMPLARIAVTSLSAARPAESDQDADQYAHRQRNDERRGRVKRKISATLGKGALLRTISSSSRPGPA